MKCFEFESLLADYLDGALDNAQRAAMQYHASECAACRQFQEDVASGLDALSAAPPVVPPQELITRIAYDAPRGRTRHPLEVQGFFSRFFSRWVQPMVQPRFAMGMAMTILSFAMLERCTGVQVQRVSPADLSPAKVWDGIEDRAVRVKDRAVKYYENIRFVYDIEVKLREMEAQGPAPSQSSQPRVQGTGQPQTQPAAPAAPKGETK